MNQLFCAQHLLPTEEHEKLMMSPEDQAIRFNMADVYPALKDAGALSSSRISGVFDLAGTYSRADQEGAGEVNLWQFVSALDPQLEVEAVARAAAARSRHQAVVDAEKALYEAEQLRQQLHLQQQRASLDQVAIERQMREQMFLEEQVMLQAQHEERQRQQEVRACTRHAGVTTLHNASRPLTMSSLLLPRSALLTGMLRGGGCTAIGMQEYAEKQKAEELRQKAEAAKTKARNRRSWQAQQFLLPWEVQQQSK